MIRHAELFAKAIYPRVRFDLRNDYNENLLEHSKLDTHRNPVDSILSEYCRLSAPNMPPIHFAYIDSPRMDAVAVFFKAAGCGYVGICTGTISLIYDMFYRMLSHPNIRPFVGNRDAESVRDPYSMEGLWTNYNDLRASRSSPHCRAGTLQDVVPRDRIRKDYAELLARHAIDFLVLHEIAHIMHGHCGFLAGHHRDACLVEMEVLDDAPHAPHVDPILRQALEMDADAYASLLTWQQGLRIQGRMDQCVRGLMEHGSNLVIVNELAMQDWTIAIFVLFWMFEQRPTSIAVENRKHLPAQNRASLAIAAVMGLALEEGTDELKSQASRAFAVGMEDAINAVSTISGGLLGPKVQDYLREECAGAMHPHVHRVVEKWRTVHDEVLSYSFPSVHA